MLPGSVKLCVILLVQDEERPRPPMTSNFAGVLAHWRDFVIPSEPSKIISDGQSDIGL